MIKKYADVLLAALFALATGLFVPFSPALLWESINWNLLGILFCLMTITAEIGKWGIPRALCLHFFDGKVTVRQLARFFTGACFFSSMVITNDISLIIFVPFSISTFIKIHERSLLIPLITLETIAANMGSMLTPIGNPQNLFIYEYFHLPLSDFLSTTAPVVFISGFFLYLAGRLFPETVISSLPSREMELPRKKSLFLLFLLLLCVLHVLRLIPLALVMAVVVPAMIFLDRKAFWEVDYKLLLLFSLLFMAVGNLGRLDILSTWARQTIGGHEFLDIPSPLPIYQQCAGHGHAFSLYGKLGAPSPGCGCGRPGHPHCFHGQPHFLQSLYPYSCRLQKGVPGPLFALQPAPSGSAHPVVCDGVLRKGRGTSFGLWPADPSRLWKRVLGFNAPASPRIRSGSKRKAPLWAGQTPALHSPVPIPQSPPARTKKRDAIDYHGIAFFYFTFFVPPALTVVSSPMRHRVLTRTLPSASPSLL